jgi:hypothetical protein
MGKPQKKPILLQCLPTDKYDNCLPFNMTYESASSCCVCAVFFRTVIATKTAITCKDRLGTIITRKI